MKNRTVLLLLGLGALIWMHREQQMRPAQMALTLLILILAAWLFTRTWFGHLPHLIAKSVTG